MAKMNEMKIVVDELRDAAEAIKNAADSLMDVFSTDHQEEIEQTTKQPAAEPEPSMTFLEARAVLSKQSRAGFTEQIREVLKKYNASCLSEVDPDDYFSLAAEVGALHHDE